MSALMESDRALKYAVLASIVLHALLLFGVSQRDRPRLAEAQFPAIIARLVEPPAAALVAEPPRQAEPVKREARKKPAAPKRVAKPAPSPQPAAEPVVQEVPMETTTPEPAASREIARAEQSTGIAEAAETAAAAPAGAAAEDPGSLEKYRLQLLATAPRYKRYPRIASDNNWKGVVALRMVVGASGQVGSFTVTKTSGYEVLDRQAQEMFIKAAADVPVPPVLRGKQFSVEVAVDYYLTD